MSKYSPLRDYLVKQTADRVTLSFEMISDIIGDTLPDSAYEHSAWWANDREHVQARAWLDEDFKSESVSVAFERVTFVRS